MFAPICRMPLLICTAFVPFIEFAPVTIIVPRPFLTSVVLPLRLLSTPCVSVFTAPMSKMLVVAVAI